MQTRIDAAIALATEISLGDIRKRPFPQRLLEKLIWLGSPYL
jgi:cardiolipin synthase